MSLSSLPTTPKTTTTVSTTAASTTTAEGQPSPITPIPSEALTQKSEGFQFTCKSTLFNFSSKGEVDFTHTKIHPLLNINHQNLKIIFFTYPFFSEMLPFICIPKEHHPLHQQKKVHPYFRIITNNLHQSPIPLHIKNGI